MSEKITLYEDMVRQARSLFGGERDPIANAANISALIWQTLPDLNWAGFYFRRRSQLVLGPFQGKPACSRIPAGSGVCGTAAANGQTVLVGDVHEFAGHIACDPASNSELVVPLKKGHFVIGVLDLDSPLLNRFDREDAVGLESLAQLWVASSDDLT
ncbi:MAG: GAF domain-containing protein [Rhizomicrobium sp.]